MNSLHYALYQYAMEHRADQFLLETKQDELENLHMVEQSVNALSAMNPIAADYAQRIYNGLNTVSSLLHQEAAFLAGLSIGVELHSI